MGFSAVFTVVQDSPEGYAEQWPVLEGGRWPSCCLEAEVGVSAAGGLMEKALEQRFCSTFPGEKDRDFLMPWG